MRIQLPVVYRMIRVGKAKKVPAIFKKIQRWRDEVTIWDAEEATL